MLKLSKQKQPLKLTNYFLVQRVSADGPEDLGVTS